MSKEIIYPADLREGDEIDIYDDGDYKRIISSRQLIKQDFNQPTFYEIVTGRGDARPYLFEGTELVAVRRQPKEEKAVEHIQIHLFSDTSRIASSALHTVQSAANEFLTDIPTSHVAAIHLEQTVYVDDGGDFKQEGFWATVMVTVRVPEEQDRNNDGGPVTMEADPYEEAKRLLASVGSTLVLEHSEGEGYLLYDRDLLPETVFWGVPSSKVLAAVKNHLRALGLIDAGLEGSHRRPAGRQLRPIPGPGRSPIVEQGQGTN
jgi:hypothetical protein